MKSLVSACILALLLCSSAYSRTDSAFNYHLHRDYKAHFPEDFEYLDKFREQVFTASPDSAPTTPRLETYSVGKIREVRDYRPIKIVTIYPSLQTSSYWIDSLTATEATLQWYGIPYEMEFHGTNDLVSPIQEQFLVDQVLKRGDVDYLIYTVDSPYQADIVENIIKSCMPQCRTKILINNTTTPLREWRPEAQPLIYAGFDHYEGGKLMAEHLRGNPNSHGYSVAVINRPHGLVNIGRSAGFMDEISKEPTIKVRSYVTDDDKVSNISNIIDHLQKYDSSPFIYSTSTSITLAVVDALSEDGDTIRVSGWGGTDKEIELYKEGIISHVIYRYADDVGVALATAIQWNELGLSPPRIFLGRFEIFDEYTPQNDIESALREGSRFRTHRSEAMTTDRQH